MKCPRCQGTLKWRTTTYTDNRNGYDIVLHDVPAWVCDQCGEPLFDSTAVRNIQEILEAMDRGVDKLRRAA